MATLAQKRSAVVLSAVTALASGFEGVRYVAYYDPPGVLTVCNGHTGPDVVKNRVYSPQECRALLGQDGQEAIDTVERCQPGLPDPVLIAFADAVFNLGPKIVCSLASSTAARMLKAKNYLAACHQLPRWDKALVAGVLIPLPGLTKRRAAELEVCVKGLQ